MSRKQVINTAGAVGYVICVLAMIWPGALIGNRIEPFVLGLPFMFFWYVLWIFVLFVGLVAMYWLDVAGAS